MPKRAATWLALCLTLATVSTARAAAPAAVPVPAAAPAAPPVSTYAPQPSVVRASIIGYTGAVSIEHGKGGEVSAVTRLPAPLGPGDTVRTGPGGRAFLQFRDGSQTTVDQRARFSIEADQPDNITVKLTLGKVWCAVSKLAGRRFLVRTPTSVAAVRGTEFTVESFGDKKSSIEVFGGLVSVRGALGDEALVGASQRVDSIAGRLAPVQRFEARPDPRMPPAKGSGGPAAPAAPGDRKTGPPPPPGGSGAPGDKRDDKGRPQFGFNPEQLKNFVAREAGQFENQNQRESSAAFEQRNELYQAGKSLIDAFGRRVRVEEFITRPAADTFKFVSVSHRDNRVDLATVEVKANTALPANLSSVGNLFSAQGANPPPFYALQQRFSLRNVSTGESYVQLGVDGAPRQFNLPGQSFFDPIANAFVTPSAIFWKTMFGNSYEFQNGNQGAVDRIWSDAAFRPFDNVATMGTQVAGMTAHFQPVHVDIRNDPGAGNAVVGAYWVDSFVSRDPTDNSGAQTGLMFASFKTDPLPGLSWNTKRIDYLDFTDTNGNGILDFGEALAFDSRFGGQVYHDIVERADGLNLAGVAGAGARQAGGDNAFAGKDAAGAPVNSGAILAYGGAGPVNLSPLLLFGLNNPRERLLIDDYVIDDLGKIQPGQSNIGQSGGILGSNYERRVRGTRYAGDIDVVVSPSFLIQSGAANSGGGGGAVRGPGQPF